MSQQPGHNQGLFGSLQSEVAPEASPLLDFLVKHTRTIILVFIVIILAIGGYWMYSRNVHKANQEQQMELGRLLVISDPVKRLGSLEEYLKGAPDSLKNQTLLAIAQSAVEAKNTEKLLETWDAIGKQDGKLARLSAVGTAGALAEQGKYKEAMTVFEGLLPGAAGTERVLINRTILNYAELTDDTPRAIRACEELLAESASASGSGMTQDSAKALDADRMLLMQKLAMLRLKTE